MEAEQKRRWVQDRGSAQEERRATELSIHVEGEIT
jgi:hypothetical protein